MGQQIKNNFSENLQQWRKRRQLSQMGLALVSGFSQRHISYLETGKSLPTRPTVMGLAQALDLSFRESNQLLQNAGFSLNYSETQLNEPNMAMVKDALEHMLSHHNPLPALVVDRLWNLKMINESANSLFSHILQFDCSNEIKNRKINLVELTLSEDGFKPHINNFDEAAPVLLERIKNQAFSVGTKEALNNFAHYQKLVDESQTQTKNVGIANKSSITPVMPLEIKIGTQVLSLFTVISTFGTPQDITTDELRIESFYPADEATKSFFTQ